MRFELTTSTLARLRSTPELRPRRAFIGLYISAAAHNTQDAIVCKRRRAIYFGAPRGLRNRAPGR